MKLKMFSVKKIGSMLLPIFLFFGFTADWLVFESFHSRASANSGEADSYLMDLQLQPFYGQKLIWGDCKDDSAGYLCATATVPLDYKKPDGKTLDIALKKLPAADDVAERGSLFVDPGGPGDSGVAAMEAMSLALSDDVRASYDIIGFDPRGVGQSASLVCWSPQDLSQAVAAKKEVVGSDSSRTSNSMILNTENPGWGLAAVRQGTMDSAKCARYSETPELSDYMGTRSVARDLDILRNLVGDTELNYWGTSYGTFIGSIYAVLFPRRVGNMVLDSAMSLTKSWTEGDRELTIFREERLRAYIESCLAQNGCPLTGSVDEAFSQLHDFLLSLDEAPLSVEGSSLSVGTKDAAYFVSSFALGSPDNWQILTEMLSQGMIEHEGTLIAERITLAGETGHQDSAVTEKQVFMNSNYDYANSAIICNDSERGERDIAALEAEAAAEKKSYPFYGGSSAYLDAYCQGWGNLRPPLDDLPDRVGDEELRPIIVTGTTGDTSTLYSWSEELSSQLEGSRLITVAGYGHGVVGANACATSMVDQYLAEDIIPPVKSTCGSE